MGDGGDDETQSAPPSSSARAPSFYSAQFNVYREREEARARLAAWQNGREPEMTWDTYGTWRVLVMTFPMTNHTLVFAAEHPVEHGRLLTWCEGCHDARCAAALYARNVYLAERRKSRVLPDDDGLPF